VKTGQTTPHPHGYDVLIDAKIPAKIQGAAWPLKSKYLMAINHGIALQKPCNHIDLNLKN
jgi:hypothetical protein